MPSWIVFELVITKLPHYVLPLYPAIAILIVGVIERRMLSRDPWLTRGTMWWFVLPATMAVGAIVLAIVILRQPVFAAWPFLAVAAILGLFAWWLYDDNRAERSLLNSIASALLPRCRDLWRRAADTASAVSGGDAGARAARANAMRRRQPLPASTSRASCS